MWYIDYINHCFFIAFVLVIWLKTEAFVEYGRIFGLSKLLEIEKFDNRSVHELTYPSFLLVNHDNFLTRLISCPICLGFWLNVSVCLFFKDFSFFFVKVLLSILIYLLISVIIKKENA
tara:strand:+ start:1113 stop:1466 length:354 start_codon:yes stop_codon:yes gene_type:complete